MKSPNYTPRQLSKLEDLEREHGTRYAYDLAVPCPACGVGVARACKGLKTTVVNTPLVHFGRRLKAMLAGLR